jgi:hypothetical protein
LHFYKGSFVKDIPYDPNYYFYGEELSMALRAFTRGYSFFHIPDVPLFHLYTDTSDIPENYIGIQKMMKKEQLDGQS